MKTTETDWHTEEFSDFLRSGFRVTQRLFSGRSDFQKVDVVDTAGHGRMLFIDDLAMIAERDEFVYHEMLAHVPLIAHTDPKRVLIIGGGDGGTAREVLKHPSVDHVVMVEIDGMVVEACRQHLHTTACELENPKLELHIADGLKYVAEAADSSFDVVLVDSTDPIGPAAPLFNEAFYQDVRRVLRPDGYVVSQAESVFYHLDEQLSLVKTLNSVFPEVAVYNYSNLTYPGGLWSFSIAYNNAQLAPWQNINPRAESLRALRYYTLAMHRSAFSLPMFQLQNLAGLIANPVVQTEATA